MFMFGLLNPVNPDVAEKLFLLLMLLMCYSFTVTCFFPTPVVAVPFLLLLLLYSTNWKLPPERGNAIANIFLTLLPVLVSLFQVF